MKTFKKPNKLDYFPELKSADDVYDYIEELYKRDTPEFEHYVHIIESLPKKPLLLHNIKKNFKLSGGKANLNLIMTEKRGTKTRYSIEIDNSFINIYRQSKPRQRIENFEHYKELSISDLYN